jgi:thiazole synthase
MRFDGSFARIPVVKLFLNGEPRDVTAATLAELVRELELDGKPIAVERNRDVVPKSKYRETPLAEGDVLEIVHLVGGG